MRPVRGLVDFGGAAAEQFRALRMAIELRPGRSAKTPVLVTSAGPGEGKSTIAANYALFASRSERRVLLIDADLRRPTLHALFGVSMVGGLSEVIVGDLTYGQAIKPIQRTPGQLGLLTAGRNLLSASDVVGSTAMTNLIEEAVEEYDLVIIDSPPVLATSDAATLSAKARADVAFVVDRRSRRRSISKALHQLDLVGANVLGLVLNREGDVAQYGYY